MGLLIDGWWWCTRLRSLVTGGFFSLGSAETKSFGLE